MERSSSRLWRVALASLAVGLLVGGAALAVQSLAARRDCPNPAAETECSFYEQTAAELARRQALGAAGCALVAAGLLLYLRSFRSKASPPAP